MRRWLGVFFIVHALAVPLASKSEDQRIDRIESDLSAIAKLLRATLEPANNDVHSDGALTAEDVRGYKSEAVAEKPLNVMRKAIISKLQRPPENPGPTRPSDVVEAPVVIVPIPGDHHHEFEKLPEPILDPNDKYEEAEDADAELIRSISVDPCVSDSAMPEADEMTHGIHARCGVAGTHQIGRSRTPGTDAKVCPGIPLECSGHGVCDGGVCHCSSLYHGRDCSLLRCAPECSPNGRCQNGTCDCAPGWRGPTCSDADCSPRCSDHGVCRNGICECDPGYEGKTCNSRVCPGSPVCGGAGHGHCDYYTGICQCADTWAGIDCSQPFRPCNPSCQNRGTCNNGTCICAPGWHGSDCSSIIPRSYACEGGAVWNENAPTFLRTCSNVHDVAPANQASTARCMCPPQAPVWDPVARACIDASLCGASPCGVMGIPAPNEVLIAVKGNTVCDAAPLPGMCSACVQAHLPVLVCWRLGRDVAVGMGTAHHVYAALYRQGGRCSPYGAINGQTQPSDAFPSVPLLDDHSRVASLDVVTNSNGSVSLTDTQTLTIPRRINLDGVPHVAIDGDARTVSGSVYLAIGCVGNYKASFIVEDNDGNVTMYGDCKFAGQNAACPGTPACSGHGSCSVGYDSSSCVCADDYHGSDCSVKYVERVTGEVAVLPDFNQTTNITTSLPIPPDADIVRVNDTTVVTSPDVQMVFYPNGTVVVTNSSTGEPVVTIVQPSTFTPPAPTCKGNQEWASCSPGCLATCRNPFPRCLPSCASGACQCPFDQPVWDEEKQLCVTLTHCSAQSPCPGIGVVCGGKGTCINGSCVCQLGWSGSDCSVFENQMPRVTTASGTVGVTTPCHFPFKFRNREYTDCTSDFDSDGGEWCSVTYEWEQRWGYCSPRGRCPSVNGIECFGHGTCEFGKCKCENGFSGVDCSIFHVRYTNVTLEPCHFPFLGPDLLEHTDCIPGMPVIQDDSSLVGVAAGQRQDSWCLKSFRFTDVTSFGYCQPAGQCGNCSSSGGVCDPNGTGRCLCKAGFTGLFCDHRLTEKEILLKLFSDTHGHGWNRRFGWDSLSEPCTAPGWTGISCRDGNVVRINLHSTGLVGTIPRELSVLYSLEVLDLSNNHLSGEIPEELLSFPRSLRTFIISNNYLTGPQPKLPSYITYADISGNFFTTASTHYGVRVTSGVGPAAKYTPCAFPFEYQGRMYTACTSDFTTGRPWCSTTALYAGSWGECAPLGTCPGVDGVECGLHGYCAPVGTNSTDVACVCKEGFTGAGCAIPVHRAVANEAGIALEVRGKACQFPFAYKGVVYNDCTTVGSAEGREWCLTTKVWEREWGFCAPRGTCPGAPLECSGHGVCNREAGTCVCEEGWGYNDCSFKIPRVTDGTHQRRGVACHFPFTLQGVEHTACTTAPSYTGRPYCAIRAGDLESHGEWDFCAPIGTCEGDPSCSGNGECYFGECACNPGFKGSDCSLFMTEKDVLIKLFRSTNGQQWTAKDGWEVGHHCSWYGIACNADGHTVEIRLAHNNLQGILPPELGLIRSLRTVDLADNELAGELPPTLSYLQALDVFNVTNTEFVESAPPLASGRLLCDNTCIRSPLCKRPASCGV